MLVDIYGVSFCFEDVRGYEPDWDNVKPGTQPGIRIHTMIGNNLRSILFTNESARVFRHLLMIYKQNKLLVDGVEAVKNALITNQQQEKPKVVPINGIQHEHDNQPEFNDIVDPLT